MAAKELLTTVEFEKLFYSDETLKQKHCFKKNPFKIDKGWGFELILHSENDSVNAFSSADKLQTVKALYFNKGKKCSLHYHQSKFEIFYLLFGSLAVDLIWNAKEYSVLMKPGDSLLIERNLIHQMTGIDDVNILLEISTQDFPDDSYRIKKGD